MILRKITLLTIILIIFTSCADQYSKRRRTILPETKTYHKSKEVIAENPQTTEENYDNNSPQEIIESVEEPPVLDEGDDDISIDLKISKILETAYSYLGTPYQYGGTTHAGIDCSGLVGNSFREVDIPLARSASDMYEQGETIALKNVEIGDLLFFATGRGRKIRHVGIVVDIENGIKFIHASTSQGVIVSSLSEAYWSKAFKRAKRIL